MELEFLLNGQPATAKQPFVLAVDDDEDSLLLLTKVLELLNCSFVTANNGRSALALVRHHQPDLILLDILLPDLNGIDMIRILKNNPSTADIPIVALTALAQAKTQQEIATAGGAGCLTKPYSLEDLEAVIRHFAGCSTSLSIA
jgi:two-component system, cell cycle response regulator DivK